jgi:hypothetical protein
MAICRCETSQRERATCREALGTQDFRGFEINSKMWEMSFIGDKPERKRREESEICSPQRRERPSLGRESSSKLGRW